LSLSFNIFAIDNLEFFSWGYLVNGSIPYTAIGGSLLEVIISSCVWIIVFYIGISSIFASTSKANIQNSIKLFQINILLLSILLFVFGIIIFLILLENFTLFLNVIGFGYYFIIMILMLDLTALKILKQE
jgi:hypothetical protein